ncbi:YihY/virulence factor BrkB family protein [Actinomycetospora endophytica]|uniref:YihY/virulence factor BrkB family protein n=1 Tax=Actinomycetospora endophytica TaxID=2291215 RepID=A0ABS8P197_9PSEU|nr:YhjD/YihY/BrkB family envelope integrity protein [Actinomycetospora endophytica]MCD2191833.1 YihY/virulence factor BrkB family protein [Actinomycetospora endophytica]
MTETFPWGLPGCTRGNVFYVAVSGRVDRFQREHRWAGFPLAVLYKFIDDLGSYQAALLTYYGFVSLFPLLLLAVTILGYILAGDPAAQQAVLTSALRNFPVIGQEIGANVHALHGSLWALIAGIAVSVYGGLGVTQAAVTTMCQIWAIPVAERPALPSAYSRGLTMLLVVGGGVLLTTALSGLTTAVGDSLPEWASGLVARLVPVVVATAINVGTFLVGYRLLTPRPLSWRQLAPGALAAALAWQALQLTGTYLIGHELQGSSASYGLFGIVLGLLLWLYLGATIALVGAQINAVRVLGLAPRSLLAVVAPGDRAVTKGDQRAYRAYAASQRRKSFQTVAVGFLADRPPKLPPASRARPGAPSGQMTFDDLLLEDRPSRHRPRHLHRPRWFPRQDRDAMLPEPER